jgi:hypothetical protein
MEQKNVASKLLLQLIDDNVIVGEAQERVWTYLMYAYAAGYDEGTTARSNKKAIMQLSLDNTPIQIFESAADASRKTNIQHSDISKCAIGKNHTAGGYKWKYLKGNDNESK